MPTVLCANCQQPVEIDGIEQPRILNIPKTIIIAIEHKGPFACPHCAASLALKVVAFQGLALGTIVANDPSRSVIPAGGSIIKLTKQ